MANFRLTGLLALAQIIGQKEVTVEEAERNRRSAETERAAGKAPNRRPKRPRKAIPPLIPVSASTWWAGVASGRFPKPVRLPCNGGRRPEHSAFWRGEHIEALIAQAKGDA